MSTEDFLGIIKQWLATATDPHWKRPYTDLVYQPMLEVMDYLRANGFRTYIVTGVGLNGPSAIVSLAAPLAAAAAEPPPVATEPETAIHGSFNNGEDFTRPRTLFQVPQRYERLPDAKGRELEKWTTTSKGGSDTIFYGSEVRRLE